MLLPEDKRAINSTLANIECCKTLVLQQKKKEFTTIKVLKLSDDY